MYTVCLGWRGGGGDSGSGDSGGGDSGGAGRSAGPDGERRQESEKEGMAENLGLREGVVERVENGIGGGRSRKRRTFF